MAAPYGNTNSASVSKGKGGKTLNDRKLAASVRTLALKEVKSILTTGQTEGNKDLYRAVLIKLAGTVLPRLNEHTGADGESLTNAYDELTTEELRRRIASLENRGHEKGVSPTKS